MRYVRLILVLLAMAMASPSVGAAVPAWEQVRTDTASAHITTDAERVDVSVRDGYIYVTTNKPITVKVLSILGQPISQQNIPAGTSRMRVASRGIYILKAGSLTKRVTV